MCMQSSQSFAVMLPRQLFRVVPFAIHGSGHVHQGNAPSFDETYQGYIEKNGSVAKDDIHFNDKVIALMGEKGFSRQEVLNDPKAFLQNLSSDDLVALHSINGVPITVTTGDSLEDAALIDPLLQVESYSDEGCLNLLSLESEMVDLNKDGDAVYGNGQFKTVFPPLDAPGAVRQAWNDTISESCRGVSSFIQGGLSYYGYALPLPPPVIAMPAVSVACGSVAYAPMAYGPVAYMPPPLYVAPPMVTVASFSAATELFAQQHHQGEKGEAGDLAARLLKRLEEIVGEFEMSNENSVAV